jgi:eukaryotic-like serine/threonine-protein kinase
MTDPWPPPTPSTGHREPQVGDSLGRYRLREVLGQGGMGRVFRALDEGLRREVALKVMLPHVAADEALRRRFLREARATAALDHPNVVPVYHVDEAGSVPFFVMPLLCGETLRARLTRERMLPVAEVLRIGRQTAEGLAHAHERGLIHRDVKPGNLWLEEGTGQVKILDFGLVRMDPESIALTQTGMVLGTVGFMAPEQEMGGEVDHRCDLYSLGCVLYLLCTGRLAVHTHFRAPHVVNASVPRSLGEVIMRLLFPEPDERFPHAQEVAEALSALEQRGPRSEQGGLVSPVSRSTIGQSVSAAIDRPASLSAVSEARPVGWPLEFKNSIGMGFVLVEPGAFLMGSPRDEEGRSDDETQHEVRINRPFWLGVCPVSQRQWKAVMGSNPAHFSRTGDGKDRVKDVSDAELDLFPVESVSWEDAQDFLKGLTAQNEEARNGRQYRLPSEAQWEYACRGGHLIQDLRDKHTSPFHFDQPTSSLHSTQANFNGNLQRPCKVGSYKPNALGLFDMHGNVWEWCLDWYDADYYENSPPADPPGPGSGSFRVVRGGCWNLNGRYCRAAYRDWFTPSYRNFILGFRVAAVPHE